MESVLMVRTAASAPTGAPYGAWPKGAAIQSCTVNVIVNFVRKKRERERQSPTPGGLNSRV